MYTVLVCDDDRAILESVKIYLTAEGYEVLTAVDGLEALELLKTREVHCLILDIMMPKLDGLSAMLKIREGSNIPIILLSAKSEDPDNITGLSFGADDYVTKPF
ncbi:MAG: response regulator, partial [Clostridia bacterium]|nr:response regulator [Clostridia bacterium]